MIDEEVINLLKKSIWHMKDHTDFFPIESMHITKKPKKRGPQKRSYKIHDA
jgi:hypothetical protein